MPMPPLQVTAFAMVAACGPYLAGETVWFRLTRGRWPRPHRAPWRRLSRLCARVCTRRATAYLDGWRDEDAPGERLLAFLLSFGLLMRVWLWLGAFLVFGDGAPDEIHHGLARTPLGEPRPDTRLGIGLAGGVVAAWMWLNAPTLHWGWPVPVQTALRLWLGAQLLPIIADLPLALISMTTAQPHSGGGIDA